MREKNRTEGKGGTKVCDFNILAGTGQLQRGQGRLDGMTGKSSQGKNNLGTNGNQQKNREVKRRGKEKDAMACGSGAGSTTPCTRVETASEPGLAVQRAQTVWGNGRALGGASGETGGGQKTYTALPGRLRREEGWMGTPDA